MLVLQDLLPFCSVHLLDFPALRKQKQTGESVHLVLAVAEGMAGCQRLKTALCSQDRTTLPHFGTSIKLLSRRLGPFLNNGLSRKPESKQVSGDLSGSPDYPPEP